MKGKRGMRTDTILKVEKEIERFKDALFALYKDVGEGDRLPNQSIPESTLIVTGRENLKETYDPWFRRGRYTTALKRASLDLTRALADLRQGR